MRVCLLYTDYRTCKLVFTGIHKDHEKFFGIRKEHQVKIRGRYPNKEV